jgi:hypothetical protein
MLPLRREKDILVHELPDETLVYDVKRNKAHCLNRTAALVWRHCDGRTTVTEMARIVHEELSIPPDEQIVWQTLDRFQRARLLSEPVTLPEKISRLSRRDWVRKLGVAAVLVPAVMTVIAPTSASAASCIHTGGSCSSASPCCAGCTCHNGKCAGKC